MHAGRRHRRRQPKRSTTRLRGRHTNTMRRAHPHQSTRKPPPDRPPSTRLKQQSLSATGCARAGLPTVHLTQNTASTRRQTTTGNVTRRVVQRPTRTQPTNSETGMTTTRTTSDRASTRCPAKEPTPNKPTMRSLRQLCTNKTAAAATKRPSTDHTQAGQHQTNQACIGRHGNGVQQVGDTVVRHARRPPYPRTQQNTATLPLRTRITNINQPHYTTLGQTKTQLTSTETDVPATQTSFGYTTTGSSPTEFTQTKPTMRRPRQPRTNHTAAAAAT